MAELADLSSGKCEKSGYTVYSSNKLQKFLEMLLSPFFSWSFLVNLVELIILSWSFLINLFQLIIFLLKCLFMTS